MAIRPRNRGYQVDVVWKGKRKRFNAPDKETAIVEEAKALAALKAGDDYIPLTGSQSARKGATLGELFDTVWRLHWSHQKSPKTVHINAQGLLKILGATLDVRDVDAHTIMELREALNRRALAASTQNKYFSILRMLLKHAQDMRYIEALPKIPHLKIHTGRLRFINSQQEEEEILAYWRHMGQPEYSYLWEFLIDTGFRIREALVVDADEDLRGNILATKHDTKGGTYRSVPLTTRARRVFDVLGPRPFEGITYGSARHHWNELKAAMGLEDDEEFVIHCLRHTCASRLVQSGVPLAVIKEWMGHKSINTTLRYAHLAPDSLDNAVEVLENWGKPAKKPSDTGVSAGDTRDNVVPFQVTPSFSNPLNYKVTLGVNDGGGQILGTSA